MHIINLSRHTRPLLLLAGSALLLVGGCAQTEQRYDPITPVSYLALEHGEGHATIAADILAEGALPMFAEARGIVDGYRRHGQGPLHVVVSAKTSQQATKQARMLGAALSDLGVSAQELAITTVSAPPYGAVASYRRVDVVAPNCPEVPVKESPLGCAVDLALARMIARPADLAGNERLDRAGSEPAVNAITRYRTNTPPPVIPSLLVQTTDAAPQ